eukprot:6117869-Prymnesium_polylepis.1
MADILVLAGGIDSSQATRPRTHHTPLRVLWRAPRAPPPTGYTHRTPTRTYTLKRPPAERSSARPLARTGALSLCRTRTPHRACLPLVSCADAPPTAQRSGCPLDTKTSAFVTLPQ